ncbi:MAG: VOC family protein [Gemmatimonadaceae bacterium]
MTTSIVTKSTPVLIVESVAPCAEFWERLGFTRVAEVPHDHSIGFVILSDGNLEIMYQSMASVIDDDASIAEVLTTGGSSLFVEVSNIADALKAVADAKVILKERTTFYGMREVGVLDPGGNVVIFAQKVE